MGGQNWLSLMEYSAKYRVSISTLRRRIKAGEMEFQFSDGKYLLKDKPVVTVTPEAIAPPLTIIPQVQTVEKKLKLAPVAFAEAPRPEAEVGPTIESLLSEIKKAYMQILQEKEEQILILRSEVSDLKTLVSVLEEQNGQLKITEPKFELDLDL